MHGNNRKPKYAMPLTFDNIPHLPLIQDFSVNERVLKVNNISMGLFGCTVYIVRQISLVSARLVQ